jgi:outer membrane lipoprotein-sorting protein
VIPVAGRRRLLGLLAVGLALPGSVGAAVSADDQAELQAIEAYLNDLTTLQATFSQIAPNGELSTGRLYYRRPDKMRLEYDPPNEILIVANDWQVVYVDQKLDQVTGLFTSQTPLGFLLDDEIRLSGDVTVDEVRRTPFEIAVTVSETDDPDQGRATLVFERQPIALRRWSVVDAQGLETPPRPRLDPRAIGVTSSSRVARPRGV